MSVLDELEQAVREVAAVLRHRPALVDHPA